MLTITEALEQVLNQTKTRQAETVLLADCHNCVLAADLATPHESPPFDKSMMDGFAVDSRTVFESGVTELSVLETITAGTLPTQRPGAGTACRIMTGAPMPQGADCVVPIEKTSFSDEQPKVVRITPEHVASERHVLRKGASATAGTDLLAGGTPLKPQHIAVLAEFGLSSVDIIPQSRVAILATGDELIPSSEPLTPGRIRNSNEPMLVAQVQRAGGIPVPLGIARDDAEQLSVGISAGLKCDVLLLSGGVSAGTLDLVPAQLAAAGVRQVLHGIHMKPGKPLWFGAARTGHGLCLVFGLPGNPVSSMVCFEMFVRPALKKLAGRTPHGPEMHPATLTEEICVKGERPTCFPSLLCRTPEGLTATPVAWGGSADLKSTALANGLCLLEPVPGRYQAGDTVLVTAWDEVPRRTQS